MTNIAASQGRPDEEHADYQHIDDDFGTEHSSLSYLRRLPVTFLKMDRSFIAPVGIGLKREDAHNSFIDFPDF